MKVNKPGLLATGLMLSLLGVSLILAGGYLWRTLGLDDGQSLKLLLGGSLPLLAGAWLLDQRGKAIRRDVSKILTIIEADKTDPNKPDLATHEPKPTPDKMPPLPRRNITGTLLGAGCLLLGLALQVLGGKFYSTIGFTAEAGQLVLIGGVFVCFVGLGILIVVSNDLETSRRYFLEQERRRAQKDEPQSIE